MKSETQEMSPQPEKPVGLCILKNISKTEPFELFSGLGFLKKDNWFYDTKEEMWKISIINHN